MAIFKFNENEFETVEKTSFVNEGILERKHLQAAIKRKIDIVAPDCLILSEEFSDWNNSQRRIDLLALDKEANIVVIEIKRTEKGEHMELQSIRYAAMVSTLTYKKAVDIFQCYLNKENIDINAETRILDFLEWDEAQEEVFNNNVRIVLVSSDFSKELTTAVLWLNQQNIDLRCVRVIPYRYGEDIFVDIQQIIPVPEAESYQVKFREKSEEQRQHRISDKDLTKYKFDGQVFNKRKLVLAVVLYWIDKNKPDNFENLLIAFPQETRKSGLFEDYTTAKDIYDKQKIYRHFLGEDELIKFADGSVYAISNQWGKGNLEKFINRARELGHEIDEV